MRYQNQTEPRMPKRVPDLPWKEGFYWAKWCIPEDGTEGMGAILALWPVLMTVIGTAWLAKGARG